MKKKFLNKRIKELEKFVKQQNDLIDNLQTELYFEKNKNTTPYTGDEMFPKYLPPFKPECFIYKNYQTNYKYSVGDSVDYNDESYTIGNNNSSSIIVDFDKLNVENTKFCLTPAIN